MTRTEYALRTAKRAAIRDVQAKFSAALAAGQIQHDDARWAATGGAEADALNESIRQAKRFPCSYRIISDRRKGAS